MNVEKDLRTELSSNTGFLSELQAMIEILSTRIEALIFTLLYLPF